MAKAPVKTIKPNFATYRSRESTHIPNELAEYFDENGYELKWIRIWDHEKDCEDGPHIAKKRHLGFEPITHAELNNLNMPGVSDLFENGSGPKTKGWITIGDIALTKRPLELKEEHIKAMEQEAFDQVHGIRRMLQENARENGTQVETYKSTFMNKQTSFGRTQNAATPVDVDEGE